MAKHPAHGVLIGMMLLLTGCQAGAVEESRPARLVNPEADVHAELEAAVSDVLGAPVTLARDALTESDVVIIERRPRQTLQEGRIPGRSLDTPERFRLMKRGDECVLVHEGSGEERGLRGARCEETSPL